MYGLLSLIRLEWEAMWWCWKGTEAESPGSQTPLILVSSMVRALEIQSLKLHVCTHKSGGSILYWFLYFQSPVNN